MFIPERNKISEEAKERKKELEEYYKALSEKEKNSEKQKIEKAKRDCYLKESESENIEIIKADKNNQDNKKKIQLAQFERFYKFAKEYKFDFNNKKIKEFISKQKERGVSVKFYDFIENKVNESKLNKEYMDILGKYLRYKDGRKRIEE